MQKNATCCPWKFRKSNSVWETFLKKQKPSFQSPNTYTNTEYGIYGAYSGTNSSCFFLRTCLRAFGGSPVVSNKEHPNSSIWQLVWLLQLRNDQHKCLDDFVWVDEGWVVGGWPISRKELPPSHKSGQGHLILLANLASSAIIGITPRMSLILQTLRNRQKKWYLDVFHAFSHKLNLNTHNYSKPNSQKNHKLFETHSHYLKPTWKNCMWGKPSFMLKISLLIIFIRP